jgi:hypothetical protein
MRNTLIAALVFTASTVGCGGERATDVDVDVTCDGGMSQGAPTASPTPSSTATPAPSGSGTTTGPDAGTSMEDGGSTSGSNPTPPGNPEATYNDVTSAANWASFDTANLGGGASAGGYITSAFDGRYVYLVPGNDGVVPRYDTRAPFGSASSWSTFDVSTVEPSAGGFRGAAFDGRYVYLVPYESAPSTLGGVAVRYDTHADFGSAAAWQSFDITTIDPACTGLFGATFDGRYLYLAPYGQDQAPEGHAARFDTWGSFTDPTAWSTFDTGTLGAENVGFLGATFDGRYVYYSPYGYQYGHYGPMVTRYDTTGTFTDPGAWSSFDTTSVDPRALGYFGTSFDGRYQYFLPYFGDGASGGLVSRYDTTRPFAAGASWSTFDVSALGVAPAGGVFDGRFLYLVPNAFQGDTSGKGSGVLARLDTTVEFTSSAAWTTFDVSTLNPQAAGFFGGAFDGEHLYLVPSWHSVVMQFDAKKPPSMPAGYHGSFY